MRNSPRKNWNINLLSRSFHHPIIHNVLRLYYSRQLQLRPHHTFNPKRLVRKDINFVSLSELSSLRWFTVSCSAPSTLVTFFKNEKRFAVNLPTPLADVSIGGTTKVYNDMGGSGNPVYRHFCGNCGSYV